MLDIYTASDLMWASEGLFCPAWMLITLKFHYPNKVLVLV